MDCSLPGSSNPGIFQARVLEWVAISFSRGSSWPRDWTQVSCIAGRRFTIWTTRESGYIQVCDGGSRQSEHQRSASKLRSLAFFVWEDASLWAWIHSFPAYLSYLSTSANPVSLFTLHLAYPPTPTSSHCPGWQHPLDLSFRSPLSHLEARNRWWLWQFLFINRQKICSFHSLYHPHPVPFVIPFQNIR